MLRMRYLLTLVPLFLAGCTHTPPAAPPPPTGAVITPAPPTPESLQDRKSSCKSLLNHFVDLATESYAKEQGLGPGSVATKRLRPMVAAQLQARGVFARFMCNCMLEMDKATIECAAGARTIEAAQACEGPDEESPKDGETVQ